MIKLSEEITLKTMITNTDTEFILKGPFYTSGSVRHKILMKQGDKSSKVERYSFYYCVKNLAFPLTLHVTVLMFVILIPLYYEDINLQSVLAKSPSFVRHEIEDNNDDINDILFRNRTIDDINTLPSRNNSKGNPWQNVTMDFNSHFKNELGIESVSYYSDGKILNTTFWLSAFFNDKPTRYIPTYSIFIDVDSANKTGVKHGQGGADYAVSVSWNMFSKKWEKIFAEGSVSGSYKVLNKTDIFTAFYDDYIMIPVDLNAIGSPDQFLVTFEVAYQIMPSIAANLLGEERNDQVKDILPWISVPEPQFLITPAPSTSTLKPGESRIIEIKINSNVNLESVVALSTEKGTGSIGSSFEPPVVSISPNGIGTSYLHVKARDNAEPQTFTLPVYETLSFPSRHIDYADAEVKVGSYLTIIIQAYTFADQFKDFWNTYGGAISLIGGAFAGGFSGFIFARLESKKKKTDDSKSKRKQETDKQTNL